jgi:hypothetical protein
MNGLGILMQRSAPPPAPAPRHAHDVIPLAPFSTITALANWIVTMAEEIRTKVCTSKDPLTNARMAPLLPLIPSKLDVAPPNATGLSAADVDELVTTAQIVIASVKAVGATQLMRPAGPGASAHLTANSS